MKKIFSLTLLMIFVLVLGLTSCGKGKLKDVDFTKEPTTMYVGDEFRFEFTLQDKVNVEWTSSNESVLTVDKGGIITAIKEGKATIKLASVNGISDTLDIEVVPNEVLITDIT